MSNGPVAYETHCWAILRLRESRPESARNDVNIVLESTGINRLSVSSLAATVSRHSGQAGRADQQQSVTRATLRALGRQAEARTRERSDCA